MRGAIRAAAAAGLVWDRAGVRLLTREPVTWLRSRPAPFAGRPRLRAVGVGAASATAALGGRPRRVEVGGAVSFLAIPRPLLGVTASTAGSGALIDLRPRFADVDASGVGADSSAVALAGLPRFFGGSTAGSVASLALALALALGGRPLFAGDATGASSATAALRPGPRNAFWTLGGISRDFCGVMLRVEELRFLKRG